MSGKKSTEELSSYWRKKKVLRIFICQYKGAASKT
ncbi:hypothetical protein M2102_002302 [Fusobacterium sp. PH5-7]|nr:hypothetical protein [Fusobacterium sp. PH5-7]